MPLRRWVARYGDHTITLCNHWSFVPGRGKGEWLDIDGRTVLSGPDALVNMGARLSGRFVLSGAEVEITGLIGWDRVRYRGQIFIDGTRIGGDATMGTVERDALEARLGGGIARYLVIYGLVQLGLPFGIAMAVIGPQGWDGIPIFLKTVAFAGGIYGLGMGLTWYALERRALARLYPARAPGH